MLGTRNALPARLLALILFALLGILPAAPVVLANAPAQAPTPAADSASPYAGLIQSVTMAAATSGADKQPVNQTSVFAPDSVIHAVVAIAGAPASTKFTAKWYATDVGDAAAPDTLIISADVTTDGTRNVDFTLTPTNNWPVGQYRVEVSINDQVTQVVPYTVALP
jgi:hypothetical protein